MGNRGKKEAGKKEAGVVGSRGLKIARPVRPLEESDNLPAENQGSAAEAGANVPVGSYGSLLEDDSFSSDAGKEEEEDKAKPNQSNKRKKDGTPLDPSKAKKGAKAKAKAGIDAKANVELIPIPELQDSASKSKLPRTTILSIPDVSS